MSIIWILVVLFAFSSVTVFTLAMCRSAGMADRKIDELLLAKYETRPDQSTASESSKPLIESRHDIPTVPLRRVGIST